MYDPHWKKLFSILKYYVVCFRIEIFKKRPNGNPVSKCSLWLACVCSFLAWSINWAETYHIKNAARSIESNNCQTFQRRRSWISNNKNGLKPVSGLCLFGYHTVCLDFKKCAKCMRKCATSMRKYVKIIRKCDNSKRKCANSWEQA